MLHLQILPVRYNLSRQPLNARSLVDLKKRCCSCSAQQIKARWCVDIKYGVKIEAIQLLQEWVRDIGSQAGLTKFNTQINSGSLGVPESRLEMEVALDSVSELDAFRASIPADLHKAWSQRAQHYIIDGSPSWQVYVSCPVLPEEISTALSVATTAEVDFRVRPRTPPSSQLTTDRAQQPLLKPLQNEARTGPVDWKGDPMVINPGDKMPFDFS